MQKLLLLYNPKAGHGSVRQSLPDMIEALALNYQVEVYPTTAKNDGKRKIEESSGFDVLGVVGGDGMLHEALNGLLNSQMNIPLAYLPSGTVNDFATTHNIPKDLKKTAELLKRPVEYPLDVGLFNNEYFAYVAAFGLWTNVSYITSQHKKNRLGIIAYWLESLKQVDYVHWENNSQMVKIKWDQGEMEEDILFGAISNSSFIAGLEFYDRKSIDLNDGLLEGFFIRRPMNVSELEKIVKAMRDHDYQDCDFIYLLKSSNFTISSSQPIDWTLDGEFGGSLLEANIRAVSEKFSVYLPTGEKNL